MAAADRADHSGVGSGTARDAVTVDGVGQPAPELTLAFAPMHKRAFGIALGSVAGFLLFGMTAVFLLRRPDPAPDLGILGEYFYGYTPSWRGAFVGMLWGFFSGFVAGWFIAFSRNLTIAVLLFVGRTRAELAQSRDFLDHI